jgi:hypothetical protein
MACFQLRLPYAQGISLKFRSVCRLTQRVNLLSKTHYTGDVFRLPSSHHHAYVNVRTIMIMATRQPKHVASVVCF